MAYLRPSDAPPLPHETVRILAEAVGLVLPAEDLEPLAVALRDQFAGAGDLARLDLIDINPAGRFDARWYD